MTNLEEQIKKQLTDHLYWDSRVDASDIKIDVNGKSVSLSGTVPTYQARIAAVNDAWKTSDVSNVRNNIKVAYAKKYKIPTDKDLQKDIYNLLKWNPYIEENDLKIKVNDGIVTLGGTTDAYWKKNRAETIASNLYGIKEIENKIAIVPSDDVVDEIVAENIVEAMDRNIFIEVDDVNVTVKKGKVTLSGKVPSYYSYKTAEEIAENTLGVTDINNTMLIS